MLLPPVLFVLWVCEWASGERHYYTTMTGYDLVQPVSVQEGLCIFVPCTFKPFGIPTSSPVFGYWFYGGTYTDLDSPVATNNPNRPVQKETRGRFHLLGDPRTNNCSLDIRDAKRIDSGFYFFRAENDNVKQNYFQMQFSVNVAALTHTPNIDIPQTLELGRPSSVKCSVSWACERGTPPIFSWRSAALTSLGPRTTLSSVLTLTPRLQDHGTTLTCQVTFPGVGMTVQKTIQINVTNTSQSSTSRVSGGADPGKLGSLPEVVLVAIGEAAIKFLLLGICFLFLRCSSQTPSLSNLRLPVDPDVELSAVPTPCLPVCHRASSHDNNRLNL